MPKFNASSDYNKTPKVKGVFNYFIHTFKLNIAPAVEGLQAGYSVKLRPIDDAIKHMSFKVSEGQTGQISKLENKTIEMSYVFKKSAKKKTIKLALEISFRGEVLKKEIIELKPR